MANDDLISQVLGPNTLQAIAGQLGAPTGQTASAVGVALPLLLGALGRNASQPGGAEAIHAAVRNEHSGLDLGTVLAGVLGGGGDGGAILGHVLGQRQGNATTAVSQASGLGTDQAAKLMAMLAPLVMAWLGNRTQQGGLDSQGLGGLLQKLGTQLSGGGSLGGSLMNAVLDQDGDGDVDLADILAAGKGTGAPPDGGLGGLLGSIFGGKP